MRALSTRGGPNEIKKNTHPKNIARSFSMVPYNIVCMFHPPSWCARAVTPGAPIHSDIRGGCHTSYLQHEKER